MTTGTEDKSVRDYR